MLDPTFQPARVCAVLLLLAASSFAVHCTPVVVGGGAGGSPSGTSSPSGTGGGASPSGTSSPSGTGGSSTSGETSTTVVSGTGGTTVGVPVCVAPAGPSIGIFSQADAQGAWSDPATGLAGNLFLQPATAGSFHTGPTGTELKYTQIQQVWGQFGGDPSWGVWFSGCVDASAFSGLTFEVWPLSAPAGSTAILRVLTASTTPAPRGTCVPKSPDTASTDCVAPWFDSGPQFGPKMPYTVKWSQLTGAKPAEDGATAATEIIGLAWVINAWVGPPPGPADIDVMANAVAFLP